MEMNPAFRAVALLLLLALFGSGPARAGDSPSDEQPYQAGLTLYARGDRTGALASFREALRRNPHDRLAIAAVRRLESELAPRAPPAPAASGGAETPRLERLLLVEIPRWYQFGRTIGDCVSAVGTVEAANARVGQLLVERRLARARKRRFRGERTLRELLRRAPLATSDCYDA